MDKFPKQVTQRVTLTFNASMQYSGVPVFGLSAHSLEDLKKYDMDVYGEGLAEVDVTFILPDDKRDPVVLALDSVERQILAEKSAAFLRLKTLEDRKSELMCLTHSEGAHGSEK